MSALEHPLLLTWEEYLALDDASPLRYEFVGGGVYCMAGATAGHERVVARLIRLLYDAADAHGCEVMGSDMLLRLAELTARYPDVSVYCDEAQGDSAARWRERPCLLVEVLSPSTASEDRFVKREQYLRIPTLLAYLIVDTVSRSVEVFSRPSIVANWSVDVAREPDTIDLVCPPTSLSVAEVFARL
jgi:Uma2 family endonuclease